jgi:catechol-2,3-dioxygenase
MTVRRIVANIGTQDAAAAKRFYQDVLGLDVLMDQGWIVTYGSDERMQVRCRTSPLRSMMSKRRSMP